MVWKKAVWAGLATGLCLTAGIARADTLVIADVNSPDMIRMQRLSEDFKKDNPGVDLQFLTFEEGVLRQKLTTDIATSGGQYDVMMIGTYEVPIWAKQKWLTPLDGLGSAYDIDDLLPPIRNGLSYEGNLYGAPFYGESSMLFYRKDLLAKAGLQMPEHPTWQFVQEAAAKMSDRDKQVYGVCLRGKPGWGDNMAFLTPMANSFGGRLFDEKWKPQFDSPEWKTAVTTYIDMMHAYGPPGASSNSFNENLTLFTTGHCGMWVDATVAASMLSDPKKSSVADQIGFAEAPCGTTCKGANWLWAWSLAVPASSKKKELAQKFIAWATGKHYIELAAQSEGWVNAPPGTRKSLYQDQDYLKAAAFAPKTLKAIDSADPGPDGLAKPKPYYGIQFAAIPEFQSIGVTAGQEIAGALAGTSTVDQALKNSQAAAVRTMERAGYYK